jgi:hypothetical protein
MYNRRQIVGFDAVLVKPSDPSTLLAAVNRTLARSAELRERSLLQRRRVDQLRKQAACTLEGSAAALKRDRTDLMRQHRDALQRIRGEYTEMPGLTLTIAQASRLWRLEASVCQDLLDRLVAEGFLKCHHQAYSRC